MALARLRCRVACRRNLHAMRAPNSAQVSHPRVIFARPGLSCTIDLNTQQADKMEGWGGQTACLAPLAGLHVEACEVPQAASAVAAAEQVQVAPIVGRTQAGAAPRTWRRIAASHQDLFRVSSIICSLNGVMGRPSECSIMGQLCRRPRLLHLGITSQPGMRGLMTYKQGTALATAAAAARQDRKP